MPEPFLSLPGAVAVPDGPDAGVPWHYGNPLGEQRRLDEGRAVALLARAVLTVSGPDRLSWLNSITSQQLLGLAPGASSETLVLDPTGRIEHAVRLVDDGERLWLLVDAPQAAGLLDFLNGMRFMLRVEPEDVTDRYAVIGSTAPLASIRAARESAGGGDAAPVGPGVQRTAPADSPVEPANGDRITWQDPWSHVASGGHQYHEGPHPGEEWRWFETVVERAELDELAALAASDRLGVAGVAAAEALRIAAWRPRFATEVDERSIPHELDWLRSAVHLEKGCYRGQETVAKVHNLGHPPRRLVQLDLDGSDAVLPGSGAEVVTTDGAVVGEVTSSAVHHEYGPIALAVIKRTVDPAAGLRVRADDAEVAAAQQVIVPPTAGAAADVPRMPRLGAVHRPRRSA
ncbi:CAF17-like 4Fe-4S cluster assembly/insertion protein YgfZ [Gryllotalpicola ginsengisoli]|uniref:CAF17-like 4Fe-4S cluster assembly/insertion protein YgfZ n=1 Tax=Gryllotalpicola ginsengisoli TaxID=444608 RepID=UPI0003B3D2F5|nr:glycine cleavage T C-terminal barrel domain-containing protein [Gryllotalpicola ginsengisoli]